MNDKPIVLGLAGLLLAGMYLASSAQSTSSATQGEGTLSQAPLSIASGATPAFLMAVDDSGSMTFQTMMPGPDGSACYDMTRKTFFEPDKTLNSGRSSNEYCLFWHVLPGPRIDNNRWGIPPIDDLGFARSPQFNPSYFDPYVTYEPWIREDQTSYGNASVTATKIDPRQNATVNLFTWRESTDAGDRFVILRGMKLPKGVRYTLSAGSPFVEDKNGIEWTNDPGNYIYIGYYPATFYLTYNGKDDPLPPGYSESERERVNNACGPGCDMWKYEIQNAAAKQNFANWFSYYGNRNRAMVAGLTISMRDAPSKLRVGYFTINNRSSVKMYDLESTTDRQLLFKDHLLKLGASGGTPNRQAVEHLGKQFQQTGSGAPVQSVCQKNTGMLFTDGYSNQDGPSGYGGSNGDNNMGWPFQDGHDNTLADIAAYYYKTNLRPDLTAGQVKIPEGACNGANPDPRLDCNRNLHMNFYGVTLGAIGDQFGRMYGILPDGSTSGDLATKQVVEKLLPTPAWPARSNGDPDTVDDIWHATINARGRYINARTPANITQAMREVISAASSNSSSSGSLGVSGARISAASFSVSPSFAADGTDWYGNLVASRLSVDPVTGKLTPSVFWRASDRLTGPAGRKIYFGESLFGVTKPTVKEFLPANLGNVKDLCANYPTSSACTMKIAALATKDEAVDYLRGDRTNEGRLRRRTTLIGDIVNSTVAISAPQDNYGYAALMGPTSDPNKNDPYNYAAYLAAKKTRPSVAYVGANDGMLHAFLGSRASPTGDEGRELFAYIPSTAVGWLGNLLFPYPAEFSHRYTVDGPVVVSDAYDGSSWRTVLVGTAGAGGRGVYALDVSNPDAFSAADVMWEVNARYGGAVGDRIGHVLGKPVVVPVRAAGGTTRWKAIFGNGYGAPNSASGAVTLFIVDIATGSIETIDAKEASGPARPNGLGHVIALDRQRVTAGGVTGGTDGYADTVYAGDLHGNMWKFDLLKTGTQRVAFNGAPLFTATYGSKRQPITGGIEAAVGPYGGVMVLFGTGAFAFDNDKINSDVQSIYAVLDTGVAVAGRGSLQQQTLSGDKSSSNNVDYFSKKGWYMDFNTTITQGGKTVASGERMVGRPLIQSGTLFFPTYAPSSLDPCAGGGTNKLYGLRVVSGAPDMNSVRVGAADGAALGADVANVLLKPMDSTGSTAGAGGPVTDIAAFATSNGISSNPDGSGLGNARCDIIIQANGSEPLFKWRACGRQSWRQVR